MKLCAIVPSFCPDEGFETVLRQLAQAGFCRILVVDDGSGPGYRPLFDLAAGLPGCEVLRHEKNLGKGRALKTAFARFLQQPYGCLGVVTVDGDGQHSLEDVLRCAAALEENPHRLVLGVRDFLAPDVPARSATGNRLTRAALGLFFGLHVSDSQTGLRGIPADFAAQLLAVEGERYEFETNMLLEAKNRRIEFLEVPIRTIYIDCNASSHFRPVRDSLRIFAPLLRFAFSGLSSALVDILLFALLNWFFAALTPAVRYLIAVAGARLCSALYNFLLNRNMVFKSSSNYGGSFLRYALLCAGQTLCSYGGTYFFSEFAGLPAVAAKILVDLFLFFVSFRIQRRWVFGTKYRQPPST